MTGNRNHKIIGPVDIFIMSIMAAIIIAQFIGICERDQRIANFQEMMQSLPVDGRDEDGRKMLTSAGAPCYHNNTRRGDHK